MKPARIAIIGVALAAGLAAAYLAKSNRAAPPPQMAATPEKVPAKEVLVAAVDLAIGAKIGGADLKWLPWPADGVGATMIVRKDNPDAISQFTNSIVRDSFVANEPISKDKLIKTDAGYLAAILPEGKRALAISIDQRGSNSAGTLILPNDHVDVICIYKDAAASRAQHGDVYRSETLLRNIRVLAIGPNVQEKNGDRVAVGETATLELDPRQVTAVALAQRTGTLTLALRSVADVNAPEVVALDKDNQYSVVRFGVATTVGNKD
jgi:pilus assembly protein CpaB